MIDLKRSKRTGQEYRTDTLTGNQEQQEYKEDAPLICLSRNLPEQSNKKQGRGMEGI